MWQGANRIRADVVDIDRTGEKRTLVADGHVITDLWEQPKDEQKKNQDQQQQQQQGEQKDKDQQSQKDQQQGQGAQPI